MKNSIFVFVMLFSSAAFSQTLYVKKGDRFVGEETYNHGATGKECFVTIHAVEANEAKGVHCHNLEIEYSFQTKSDKLPELRQKLFSANTMRRGNERSCAALVDNSDNGDTVFGQNTSGLYNPLFNGQSGGMWNRSSFFMVFSPSKYPSEAKISNVRPTIEREWVCANLRLVK